jgi:hypothetical protein
MQNKFRTGDRVRVRSAGEIRDTLDTSGKFDGVPFMPEMFEWCGQEFRVSSTAHKTCDTVSKTGGRALTNTVHLDDLRCDGSAHGGCDAHCLVFWKEAWLVPAASIQMNKSDEPNVAVIPISTQRTAKGSTYSCQATELPRFTRPLPWWDMRQYLDDVRGGNHDASTILRLGFLKFLQNRLESGVGFRFFLPLYNFFQAHLGGVPRTVDQGCIDLGERTPNAELNLQPGEYVEVKAYHEIQATLDRQGKNRGMRFDIEMKVHCGKRFRVAKRVEKIVNEQTGELLSMKTPSVILDGGVCLSRFSTNRMFCPRALPNFWREIWLRRVPTGDIPLLDVGD